MCFRILSSAIEVSTWFVFISLLFLFLLNVLIICFKINVWGIYNFIKIFLLY